MSIQPNAGEVVSCGEPTNGDELQNLEQYNESLHEVFVRGARTYFNLLLGAVGFVLLKAVLESGCNDDSSGGYALGFLE